MRNKITKNKSFNDILQKYQKIFTTDLSILVEGESGVGKEVVSQYIFDLSHGGCRKYIKVNCATLSEQLLESELFGHSKGAFTGAENDKTGLIEAADHGTLLMDEIGELPISLQAKLLRVLQEKCIRPVGKNLTRPVNVRFLFSTNKNLLDYVKKGLFREDLYYRICGAYIYVPPLRDRYEDVLYLSKKFLQNACEKYNLGIKSLSSDALRVLLDHNWPGNIRELQTVIHRSALTSDKEVIDSENLLIDRRETKDLPNLVGSTIREVEKKLILKTLAYTHQNKSKASDLLGISTKTLRNKLFEYNREAQ